MTLWNIYAILRNKGICISAKRLTHNGSDKELDNISNCFREHVKFYGVFVAKAGEKFPTLLSIIWPPFQKSAKAGWLTWGCPGCLPTPRSFSGHSQSHSLDFVITLIYSTSCISDSNPDICGLSTESPPPLSLWPLLLSLLSFLARPPSSLHPPWVCGMQNRSLPAVSWTRCASKKVFIYR